MYVYIDLYVLLLLDFLICDDDLIWDELRLCALEKSGSN